MKRSITKVETKCIAKIEQSITYLQSKLIIIHDYLMSLYHIQLV